MESALKNVRTPAAVSQDMFTRAKTRLPIENARVRNFQKSQSRQRQWWKQHSRRPEAMEPGTLKQKKMKLLFFQEELEPGERKEQKQKEILYTDVFWQVQHQKSAGWNL